MKRVSGLKIMIWNARGWSNKKEELQRYIREYDINVVTEIKCGMNDNFRVSGYKSIIKNRISNTGRGIGGVGIFIKGGIGVEEIDMGVAEDEVDCVGIRIKNIEECEEAAILGIYRRPGPTTKKTWRNLLSSLKEEKNIILTGDFNAHNVIWNCEDTDRNGEVLWEVMEENDMIIVNDSTKSRIGEGGVRSSNIDLVFSTRDIFQFIECSQLEDSWGSDHFPIVAELKVNRCVYKKKTNRLSKKKTDWERYEEIMIDMEDKIDTEEFQEATMEKRYDMMVKSMIDAVEIATHGERESKKKKQNNKEDITDKRSERKQIKRINNEKNPVQWWDEECEKAIEERKEALKKYYKDMTMENFIEYKRLRAVARKVIRRKKRENFVEFAGSLNKNSDLSYVWKKMKIIKNSFNVVDWKKWQGEDREKVIRKEIDKIAPPWVEIEELDDDMYRVEESSYNKEFLMSELQNALRRVKTKSSPGLDHIEYKMLQKCGIKMKTELLIIFNECFRSGYMMKEWKRNQVIFIDKANKEKVRPITMSSCISKILERMINDRLMWWLEHNKLLDESQNGFRKGRSCNDNIARLSIEVEKGLMENDWTLVVFLDISSAYDNVNRKILIEKLNEIECPTKIVRYIDTWMKDRSTKLIINEKEEEERVINKGLPQGGVLSPLLYAVYTRNLGKDLEEGVNMLQYADDVAVYITGKNIGGMEEKLERSLEKLDSLLLSIGLEIEPSKTKLIGFNRKGEINRNRGIELKGEMIRYEREASFLGIVYDVQTTYRRQIETMKGKVEKRCNILRWLNRVSWGMEVNTALLVYKAFVRSVIDYGLFVVFPKDLRNRNKVEKLQYKGIRIALGYRNSTPTNVMVAEAKVMRMEERAGFLARNFWVKKLMYGSVDIIESIMRYEEIARRYRFVNPRSNNSVMVNAWTEVYRNRKEMARYENFDIFNTDYWCLVDNIETDIKIGKLKEKQKSMDDSELLEKFIDGFSLEKNVEIFYTDGSKMENRNSVGVGIVKEESDMGYKMSINNKCSIYTAEVLAIENVLGLVLERQTNRDILILTDSMSVVKKLKANGFNAYENEFILSIRKRIYDYKNKWKEKRDGEKDNNGKDGGKNRVVIGWIPGHMGIRGNELADSLAKEATEEIKDDRINVPYGDWKKYFKKEMLNLTKNRIELEAEYKGKVYFDNYYKRDSNSPWFKKWDVKRGVVTLANRLRANHYNLNESLARKNYIDNARCECGAEVQDIEHIVWSCNQYDEERFKLYAKLEKWVLLKKKKREKR